MYSFKELRDKIISDLDRIYPHQESTGIADRLLESYTGYTRKDAVLDPGITIGEETRTLLDEKVAELMQFKPIQYITNKAYFFGIELEVNPSVLIPRPETEELVKWITDDAKGGTGLRILDIGTGSGCIIIALGKQLASATLLATDISMDALQTAMKNADNNAVKVEFVRHDILSGNIKDITGPFDIIVSNPPYVRDSEKAQMMRNVLDYEPGTALFVPDDDPLVFYRAIAGFAKTNLAPGGNLYLEINENLGEETVGLLTAAGFRDILLRKDMQGKDRMIRSGLCVPMCPIVPMR